MNKLRHPIAMLIAGTLVGFLSGLDLPLVYGVRGAGFGFCLTLTAYLVKGKGWNWPVFIPGLVLGLVLGMMNGWKYYDYITAINCTVFVPAYAYAYHQPKFLPMLWQISVSGFLCTVLRTIDSQFEFFKIFFFRGTVLFLSLWLVAMWLTDPRFIHKKTTIAQPESLL